MTSQLLEFCVASLVIIVVPGPDLVLLLRNAAAGGRRGAASTAAGIMVGNGVLAAAAVMGLTALLTGSASLYTATRMVGAGYLVYLGVRSLTEFVRHGRAAGATPTSGRPATPAAPAARADSGPTGHPANADHGTAPASKNWPGTRRHFRQGLMSNLLNPKVSAFYLSLFPQFELRGLSTLSQHAMLAGLFWTLALTWYVVVVAILGSIQRVLLRRRVQRSMAGLAGVGLVGLGATLAVRG